MADISQSIAEFERTRSILLGVSAQKNQLQVQSEILEKTLEELKDSKEEKVYKAVGSIIILTDSKSAQKDIKDQKESVDLRYKAVDKQESTLVDKLNKLKSEIEKNQAMQAIPSSDEGMPDTTSVM